MGFASAARRIGDADGVAAYNRLGSSSILRALLICAALLPTFEPIAMYAVCDKDLGDDDKDEAFEADRCVLLSWRGECVDDDRAQEGVWL